MSSLDPELEKTTERLLYVKMCFNIPFSEVDTSVACFILQT
jgi:hypothetical protein